MELPPPAPVRRRRLTPARLPGELTARAFTALLPELVRPLLPPELAGFAVRGPMFSLVGFYYGADPKLHYEVWVQRRLGLVEVGLHLEADAATNAAEVRATVATTPLDRLMLETDAPFLAPMPHRGKRCESAYVREVAAVVAQAKGCSLDELSAATCRTARQFFAKLR